MILRPVRTSQPQGGIQLTNSSGLLTGKPLVVLTGGCPNNLVTGKPLTVVGTDSKSVKPSGLAHANNNSGEIGATIEALGSNDYVDFWFGHAVWDTSKEGFYIIGDYTGSAGTGVFIKHAQASNNVGLFNGASLQNSGFLSVSGERSCIVLVKKAEVFSLYINGVFKVSSSVLSPGQSNWAVGNVGLNQGATVRTPSETLLAGRIGYASWTTQQVKAFSENPWQIFAPDAKSLWVPDTVSAGGGATVIPIGVQATGSVGTPSATGAATTTPAGVSASSAVGTPVAVGGASIPATVLPAGVQATSAVGTVSATGAALSQPVGVTASGAVGAPVAIAGTSIPATVLPAGVQALGAVGTPAAQGVAIAQPLGVAATAYVGTPTIATGVSGVAVAYPAGVQAIGQVGTLIATGAAWTAAVGVQAAASVGTPTAYAGEIVIYIAGAQTRPSRLQSSSRPSRLQTGTRASR